MRLALVASLVINVFLVVTIVTGTLLKGDKPVPPGEEKMHMAGKPMDPSFFSPRAFEALPEAYRQQMRDRIRAQLPQARALHLAVREKRREALELMRQSEFDEAAFRAVIGDIDALHADGQNLMYGTMLDLVMTLPDEERVAFAERLIEQDENMANLWEERREKWRERRSNWGEAPATEPDGN